MDHTRCCAFVISSFLVAHLDYSLSSANGEIIMWALCVPGFIIQGWLTPIGFREAR